MRLDANRAYSEADACRFAMALDPAGIELFEQPCPAEDWEANARVASVSPVPVMLDEPICELTDVKRASAIANVGFCKLKLKRFGGLDLLREALDAVHEWGMEAVLGDGLSSELGCWMEACVARVTIRNAGEFNGFLKPNVRLFAGDRGACTAVGIYSHDRRPYARSARDGVRALYADDSRLDSTDKLSWGYEWGGPRKSLSRSAIQYGDDSLIALNKLIAAPVRMTFQREAFE